MPWSTGGSVQGGRQRCHQDNPSCSFAHQKASNPPYSYSFLMFTVVFKMHCFWYKTFFVSRLLRHSGNQLRIIHLTRCSPWTFQPTLTMLVFLARSHINIVPGSIKRAQISLSVASSKDSPPLLMPTLVRDPRSIIASMLRAPSSWKAHLRNGPTMVSTTMNSILY